MSKSINKKSLSNISVGIFVYNEEKNIRNILDALIKQKTNRIHIDEIIVVSSGSTDNTNKIVKDFSKKNKVIKLIEQAKREGKASAINLFLKNSKNIITVIESGDTIPREDCIENLCSPFLDNPKLGLTGARAIPTNDKNTFLGFIVHFWWWAHNELPRFGEMIAFRKDVVDAISDKTAVDEAYIEATVTNEGYEKKQVADAVISNHGAETLKDLIKQRKRVYIGHKLLKKEKNYSVQSFNVSRMGNLALRYLKQEKSIKGSAFLFGGVMIEIYSRLLGMKDIYITKKNPYIWDISKTTKTIK